MRSWQGGLAFGLLAALALSVGTWRSGGSGADLALSLALAVALGFAVFLMWRSGYTVWLGVFLAGTLAGLSSAVGIFRSVPFAQQGFVAVTTASFWAVLFLFVGALAEFVRRLYRRIHRLDGHSGRT